MGTGDLMFGHFLHVFVFQWLQIYSSKDYFTRISFLILGIMTTFLEETNLKWES